MHVRFWREKFFSTAIRSLRQYVHGVKHHRTLEPQYEKNLDVPLTWCADRLHLHRRVVQQHLPGLRDPA